MSRFVHSASCAVLRGIFGYLGPVHVWHRERSALSGGYLLAANHISHFDPPLISISARRRIDWMAMAELFGTRWSAAFFHAVDTIRTDRTGTDRAAVRIALERLRRGRVVGIFPEGGIRAGAASLLEGAPMRPGAAALAQMADVPILPCVTLGGDRLYSPGCWRPLRRVEFWVGFGEPVRQCPGLPKAEARARLEEDLARALRTLYGELQDAFRLQAADLPHTPQERRGPMRP